MIVFCSCINDKVSLGSLSLNPHPLSDDVSGRLQYSATTPGAPYNYCWWVSEFRWNHEAYFHLSRSFSWLLDWWRNICSEDQNLFTAVYLNKTTKSLQEQIKSVPAPLNQPNQNPRRNRTWSQLLTRWEVSRENCSSFVYFRSNKTNKSYKEKNK